MSSTEQELSPTSTNTAHLQVQDNCAVIALDNPPVNGLGMELRQAISKHLKWAEDQSKIECVILIGANGIFCAGADIRQMNTPKYWTSPRTIELAAQIDTMSKPVVALMSGIAMGGGLELSLGCHHRIAMEDTQIAQPEIKLGLLPGGGGILRLPRLIGLENAIEMLLNGETIDGNKAYSYGLIDEVVPKGEKYELLNKGLTFAKKMALAGQPLRRTRDIHINNSKAKDTISNFRMKIKPSDGMAPVVILDCIEASLKTSFEEGTRLSNDATQLLMQSQESAALRYLFFIQRQASKLPARKNASQNETISSEQILAQPIKNKRIKVHLCGRVPEDWLSSAQSNGFELEVVGHDFNANLQIFTDDLALRLYNNSNIVEILYPINSIESEELARLVKWVKKMQKIPILSQSKKTALVTSLLNCLTESILLTNETLNDTVTKEISQWGLGEFLTYVRHANIQNLTSFQQNKKVISTSIKADELINDLIHALCLMSDDMVARQEISEVAGLDLIAILEMGFPKIKGGPNFYHSNKENTGGALRK
jgi:enoyl-CoA hydratase/carnithine racemase